jgi:hypothetical protein
MQNKKLLKISIILLAIGFVCIIVPAILMMTGFKNEPEGEHILLSIMLGVGVGLLISVGIYEFCSRQKIKNLKKAGK